jgi:hypothetical protein
MKWTVAIVAVVVGVTGVCRADDAATQGKALLYEEDQANPAGTPLAGRVPFVGSVVWTDSVAAARDETPIVQANIEVPARGMTARLILRRNDDKSLHASHTIELVFNLRADLFGHGLIANIPGILMKQGETARGAPLKGVASKVTTNVFLIRLSDSDMQRNVELLTERSWFNIPIVYADGKRAILAVEKAPLAEQALERGRSQ